MPLFRMTVEGLNEVKPTSFATEGVMERGDLQRVLRDQIEALDPDLFVVCEEFGHWEDSRRRIDLLAIDRDANLVVIELKRSDDESFMDLQAIRYAAMVANMTLDQVVGAHARYLRARENDDDPRSRIDAFLRKENPEEATLQSARPRLVLVSGDFSVELTTSVLWLNSCGIDVRAVRVRPYRVDDALLLDVS